VSARKTPAVTKVTLHEVKGVLSNVLAMLEDSTLGVGGEEVNNDVALAAAVQALDALYHRIEVAQFEAKPASAKR
jgi:hypothetical protein